MWTVTNRSGGRSGRWFAAVALFAAVTLTGCASPTSTRTSTGTAVAVRDCQGRPVTFSRAPKRVVTLDGYVAVSLARLGLADRIVGTGYPAPIRADTHDSALAHAPVLSQRAPATEVVAAARPDLVLTGFSGFAGQAGSPTAADLATMNVPGLATCLPGGAATAMTDLSPTYDLLLKLGTVFRVEDRARRLVARLRTEQRSATAPAGQIRPRVLVLEDDPVAGQPLKTAGAATVTNALIGLAGGQSIFPDVTAMHADISLEEVIRRDPQVIWVLTDVPTATTTTDLVHRVSTNPLLARTSAARAGRVVETSQYLVAVPSPLNLDALKQLAAALRAGGS
jgi:iron complex transport system substrate-binding protein